MESLLCHLTAEQQQLDTLRASVAEETEAIALETDQVLIMKEVRMYVRTTVYALNMCSLNYYIMQEAEQDVQAVLPDLDRAEHGLRNLDKKHFDEIR